ncbi:hypothetical protein D3C73_428050 [compost metagenome]
MLDLSHQRRNSGLTGSLPGPVQRLPRRVRLQAPNSDPRQHQFMGCPQGRWQWAGVESGQQLLCLIELADQQQTADLQITRMGGIDPVTVVFKGDPRRFERLDRPPELPRSQGDFGLSHHTSRPGQHFLGRKGPLRPLDQRPGPHQIAQLRHGDTAQGQGRRIVAQGHAVQCAQRIARRQRLCSCRDHRVHRNPATLVTPIIRYPGLV